jgi:hypothetical protein
MSLARPLVFALGLAPALVLGCGQAHVKREPAALAPEPAPAPLIPTLAPWAARPNLAVLVSESDGLVAVQVDTGEVSQLAAPGLGLGDIGWCRTDPRAGVVWFTTRESDESESWDLAFVDLATPGAAARVVRGLDMPEVAIAYPDEVIDLPAAHRYQLQAVLVLGESPRLEARVGCDGDMGFSCFEDSDDDAPEDSEMLLREDLRDQKAAIERLTLDAPEHLIALARRALPQRALVGAGELGDKPTVRVAKKACEALPERCGTSRPVPGTPWLEVVVANTRGDFYYESRQLYDPKKKRFIDPAKPTKTSAKPFEDGELGAFEIGDSGAWLLGDRLVSPTRGLLYEGRMSCGFAARAVSLRDSVE